MKPLIYLLQVSACTGIFYAFYFVFLRRLTFFTVNRIYLIATLFLSFVIPLLTINLHNAYQVVDAKPIVFVQHIRDFKVPAVKFVQSPTNQFEMINLRDMLILGYYTVAFILTIRLLFTLIVLLIRTRGKKLAQVRRVKILQSNKKLGNSSFFNTIFINNSELTPAEAEQIIAHEMLHIKLMHSADRLLTRIIQVVLWFNPFVYFYMRSIEENHEFEVDRIISRESDKSLYAELLLKLAVTKQSYLLHSFSKAPLKKRITMLFNQPTPNMNKIIYLLALPTLVISCLGFAKLRTTPTDPGFVKQQPKPRISALGDMSKFGPHPKVTIDGTVYPDDILYTISPSCIASTASMGTARIIGTNKQYKNNDGSIEITTKHHKITYLTKIERENLEIEAAVDTAKFYVKLVLKNEDGSSFYKYLVHYGGVAMSRTTNTDEKIVFLIDGEPYAETEADKVEAYIKSHKIGESGTLSTKTAKGLTTHDIKAYDGGFYFKTEKIKGKPIQLHSF